MDLAYTETQRMLLDTVRSFVANEAPKERVREIDDSPTGFSVELWEAMAKLGLPAMAVDEALGGTASTLTDFAMVFEALGEGATPSPLLAHTFAAYLLSEFGGQGALLSALATGERLAVVALTEQDYGWERSNLSATAEAADSGFVLRGVKSFAPYAHIADDLLVVASSTSEPKQTAVFLVPPDAKGMTVRRQSGWFGEPVCEVTLDGVAVDGGALLSGGMDAWPSVERAAEKATALLCASMLGGAQRVAEMALAYSKSRVAFGAPIGTFQRVQDLVIAALNDADAIRWSTYEALWKMDEGKPDASAAVSMAKAIASEGFPRACENSHYVHAGIGMDLDYGLTHHTKRSRFASLYLGGATHHKLRMARLLGL